MVSGRPTKYSQELADLICEKVATTQYGLVRLCEMHDDIPSKFTINLWRHKHAGFSTQYAQAKLKQADLLAEECLDLSEEMSATVLSFVKSGEPNPHLASLVNTVRVGIDTRKWLASKLLPKQYGIHAEEKSNTESLVEKIIDKLSD